MTQSRRHPGGFTLLEMLVAASMTALLAASLYASFHVAFRARQSAEADLEPIRAARLALELIGHDLQSALPPTGMLAAQFSGQDRTDSSGRTADVLSFFGAADGGVQLEGRGDVQQVIFSFEDEDDLLSGASTLATLGVSIGGGAGAASSGSSTSITSRSGMGMSTAARASRRQDSGPSVHRQVLARRVIHNLLSPVALEPEPEVLCRNVVGFNLAYYDGTDWYDTWDSTGAQNTAPLAVEVTLDIELPAPTNSAGETIGDPTKYTLRRVFALACGQIATSTITSTGGSSSGTSGGGTSGGGTSGR